MKQQSNTELGRMGEDMTAAYLVKKGYQILARNYRYDHCEIDLIVQMDKEIIFVEVKLRTEGMMEFPEQAVGHKKQRNLRIAAEAFMEENDLALPHRFDIVAVVKGKEWTFEHFEDAFYPFDYY